jgi:hypothetical protein
MRLVIFLSFKISKNCTLRPFLALIQNLIGTELSPGIIFWIFRTKENIEKEGVTEIG